MKLLRNRWLAVAYACPAATISVHSFITCQAKRTRTNKKFL